MAKETDNLVPYSPQVIALAEEHGITEAELEKIEGSGKEGTIIVPDVKKLIKEKKAEGGNTGGDSKGKNFYYIVKKPAFKSDTEIVDKGIYQSKVRIERFDKMPDRAVSCFEGAIDDSVVIETAKNLGIETEIGGKMVKPETLLEQINPQEL